MRPAFSNFGQWICALLIVIFSVFSVAEEETQTPVSLTEAIKEIFPEATEIRPQLEDPKAWPIYQVTELIGYAFLSGDYAPIPGFSGAPYQLLVGIDRDGFYRGVKVLEHHEPIFLHGLGPEPMHQFTTQYPGLDLRKPIKITSATVRDKQSGSNAYIDGITKATISAVVLNESVMLSAIQVAEATGIVPARKPPAIVNDELYEPANWSQLVDKGFIGSLRLNTESVNEQFSSDHFEGDDDGQFIHMHFAYLNLPTVGRNILGDEIFESLMTDKLEAGEHAILLLNEGPFSILGENFTPGTPSDRLALEQDGVQIELRDLDFFSVVPMPDIEALQQGGMPDFTEINIFRVKAGAQFDPSSAFNISLIVNHTINFLLPSEEASFPTSQDLPDDLFIAQTIEETKQALWVEIWKGKRLQIIFLVMGLVVLTGIIFGHKAITTNPYRFRFLRWGFLLYTLVFIGYITQAQLSITNLFMVIKIFTGDSNSQVLLLDPIIFILWCYVLVTLIIWGRGYFCGWLCPFGILQEMAGELAKALKIKQIRIPFRIHRRLWGIKYLVLATLVGLSLWSITTAERAAEVEPFKTAITLGFIREWPFVVYAVLLLVASLYIHKFFCRYLCPLGALLSVIGHFPLVKWLPRRAECGSPCQVCTRKCGIAAIEPSGKINYRECIQCYDCEVIYRDDKQCAPLMNAAKARKNDTAAVKIIEP